MHLSSREVIFLSEIVSLEISKRETAAFHWNRNKIGVKLKDRQDFSWLNKLVNPHVYLANTLREVLKRKPASLCLQEVKELYKCGLKWRVFNLDGLSLSCHATFKKPKSNISIESPRVLIKMFPLFCSFSNLATLSFSPNSLGGNSACRR